MHGQIIWSWWLIKQFASASTVQKVYKKWFGQVRILLYSFVNFKYTDLNHFLVGKAAVIIFKESGGWLSQKGIQLL